MAKLNSLIPGFAIVLSVSFLSILLSPYILIGSVACAIILGILTSNLFGMHQRMKPGISFCEKTILGIAIALMGVYLNAAILETISFKVIILIIFVILSSFISAYLLGKAFKLPNSLSILIGAGNGICGSSAIAASSSAIGADNKETGLSIAVINILGAVGIFLLPGIIKIFGIEGIYERGILIGGTIQAVGQVTAAGFIMGDEVGQFATLIKMFRILMLGPVVLLLSYLFKDSKGDNSRKKVIQIPGFIIGFIATSLIANLNILPVSILSFLGDLSKYLLILAMSAIGLNVSFSFVLDKGLSVISVASIAFLMQIAFCILLMGYFV